ncbi:MAG: ion transporter [Elainellaceae cyanobacterium]
MTIRHAIQSGLNDLETSTGRVVNLAIASLVLISSAIFVVETYPIQADTQFQLRVANTAILIVFSVEYLLRLWSADDRQRFLLSLYSWVDLLAIVPFFLGAIDISFLLILRWFRLLKLIRFIRGKTAFGYWTDEDSLIFARILFTLFAIIFIYSGLIYQVEHPKNPDEFRTFLDAMYFSVATMTTVGFGDITPISEAGRLLTILMIWSGIALIPWQIGDLIRRLIKTINKVETPCPDCGLTFHDADAQFCRACGTQLVDDGSDYEQTMPADSQQEVVSTSRDRRG